MAEQQQKHPPRPAHEADPREAEVGDGPEKSQLQIRPQVDPRGPDVISPLSDTTPYPPHFGTSLVSPPSKTAFEDDAGRGGPDGGAAGDRNPTWFAKKGGDGPSSALGMDSVVVPGCDSGVASLSGFERDAKRGMKGGGTVYPINDVRPDPPAVSVRSYRGGAAGGGAPSVRSTIASASAYDGAMPVAPIGASPGGARTGLSAAAQRELTARDEARRAAAALPKISPLVMELSPNAIDRGVKLHDQKGSVWSRFLCFTGSV